MLSLPRKQPSSGAAPDAGTVSPFGGAAPFPLVVLPGGGGAGLDKPHGREIFSVCVRREAPIGLTPRQALVQALAGNDFPWKGADIAPNTVVAPEAPPSVRRMAISVPAKAAPVTPAAKPTDAAVATSPLKLASAPTPAPVKAKLRIATRMSTPPFPVAASLPPEGTPGFVQPEAPLSPLSPLVPLVPVPSWHESDMGSPMLPIPEPKVVLGAGGATLPRADAKAGSRVSWPMNPPVARVVAGAVLPPTIGAGLPVNDAPRKRSLWPVMAALLVMATLGGAGAWWWRNTRPGADRGAVVAAPATAPVLSPAAIQPAAPMEPSEAFRIWARNARISGVREGEQGQVRALVNGRLFLDGDLVDATLGLRMIGQSKTERRLIFEEGSGARLEVAY